MNTSYYKIQRQEIVPLLPKQYTKVLEIGCGEGIFRDNLNQEHEYWGVEPIKSVAEVASNKLDKVLIGTYDEVYSQIPNNYFDLVICNDVIEHLPDHDKFFQSIKNKIKKDGCLVASIPNVRFIKNLFEILINKDWKYKSSGILDKTHLRFFTKKSLKRTIINNDFLILQLTGINPCGSGSYLKRYLCIFATLLFGQDTKFVQFGIRIKPV